MSALNLASPNTSKVQVSASATTNNLQAWTILAWVYRTASLASGTIFSKGSSGTSTRNPTWQLRGNDGATLVMAVNRATTNTQLTANNTSLYTLPLNVWAFIACVFDTTTAPQFFLGRLENKAVEDTTAYSTQTLGSGAIADNSAEASVIGNDGVNNTQNKGFPGLMWGISLWNRRLALDECVSQQFNFRPADGCVGFWRMGGYGLSRVVDESGANNFGIITSAVPTNDFLTRIEPKRRGLYRRSNVG